MTRWAYRPDEKTVLSAERIARAIRVPYWLILPPYEQPSWWRRPVWRMRALVWRWRP